MALKKSQLYSSRAAGDDLLGDACEYLMRHFATDSGKSKEQFYTPAEVSRVSLYGKQAVKGYTLNSESLRSVDVQLPRRDEQSAIATILTDMDADVTALEARSGKSRALKQGMMQQLLTGRVRLVKPSQVDAVA